MSENEFAILHLDFELTSKRVKFYQIIDPTGFFQNFIILLYQGVYIKYEGGGRRHIFQKINLDNFEQISNIVLVLSLSNLNR